MTPRRSAMILLWLVLAVVLVSPAGFGQQSNSRVPKAKAATAADGGYQLSPNDVITVTVFQEDDLTATTRIAADGTVQLPLIGSINIGRKTVHQAAKAIEAALREDYLVNPQVSVTVTEFAKRRFAILGQVQRPGTYEIPANESLDVIQAIGLAGGYTRSANPGKIIIKRAAPGGDRIFRVNGKELARSGREKSFRIMPGDTITVEESFF